MRCRSKGLPFRLRATLRSPTLRSRTLEQLSSSTSGPRTSKDFKRDRGRLNGNRAANWTRWRSVWREPSRSFPECQRFRHEAEEDVIALSLAIARRILHREITVSPDALLGLLKAALEKIEVREIHRVRVSRQDAPLVQQHLDQIGLHQRVELVPDPGLERGSAILESSRGVLDVSVETQLAEIERGFADLVRRA